MAEPMEDLDKVKYPAGIKNTNLAKGMVDLGDTLGHTARAGLRALPDVGGMALNTAAAVGAGAANMGNEALGKATGYKFKPLEYQPYKTDYTAPALADAKRSGLRLMRRMGMTPVPAESAVPYSQPGHPAALPLPKTTAVPPQKPVARDRQGGTFTYNGKTTAVPKSTMTAEDASAQYAKNTAMPEGWVWDPKSYTAINSKTGATFDPRGGKTTLPKNRWFGPDGKPIMSDITDDQGNVVGRRPMVQEGTADELDAQARRGGSAMPSLDYSSPANLLSSAMPMAMNVGRARQEAIQRHLNNEELQRKWGVNFDLIKAGMAQQLQPYQVAKMKAETDKDKALAEAVGAKGQKLDTEQRKFLIDQLELHPTHFGLPKPKDADEATKAAYNKQVTDLYWKIINGEWSGPGGGGRAEVEAATPATPSGQMPKKGETKTLSDGQTKIIFKDGKWQRA